MHSYFLSRLLRLLTIIIPAIVLIGCIGSGGSGPNSVSGAPRPPQAGLLVNSNVTGAQWETSGGESGLTDDGEYSYERGETVTFSVGDIVLGVLGVTVDAASVLTPVELTGSTNPTDQAATNLYVFLQTIDENSPNSADGILITAATRAAFAGQTLNFNSDSATFTADFQALLDAVLPGKTIVSEEEALGNFCEDTYIPGGGESAFGYPFPGCEAGAIVDLLTNGDFEAGDASSGFIAGTPPGWDGSFNGVSLGSCLFDSCQQVPAPRSGDQVLKMFGPFTPEGAAGAYQDVEAVPGETYTASAWANNSSVDPLQGDNLADVQLIFLDANGDEIVGAGDETLAGVGDLPVDTWVQLEASAVAPQGAAFARIQLLHIQLNDPVTGGAIFWDDATLLGPSTAPPPTITELLTNGDFEAGDASGGFIDGTPPGWDGSFNGVSLGSCLFDSCQQVPAPRSDDQVLKMFGPFTPEGAAGAYQDVEAIPGETYTASAWANNSSVDPLQGSNLADVQLIFLDANGDEIVGAGDETLAGVGDLPADTWVQLEASAVAPQGAAFARIQLLHIQLNNPVTGGSIFWDDASLTGPSTGIPPGFDLVFADEFNDAGPVAPDPTKWTAEVGNGPPENDVGFGNNEWQAYTMNPDNLRVEGGNLVIQAQCLVAPCISEVVDPGNGSITSAKIFSRDKYEFQYGIVRGRIKAPGGFAAWPAFWMLGAVFPTTPWPSAGEMDIFELFQNNSSPFETHSTIHFCNQIQSAPEECNFDNGYNFITDSLSATERWSDDFHIYELEWNPDRIIMRVDGTEVFNNAIDPTFMEEFRSPFYLILNVAMGGNLGPGGNLPPDPNRTFGGEDYRMLVDWVRVYQAVP